jgi:hypothetical protein
MQKICMYTRRTPLHWNLKRGGTESITSDRGVGTPAIKTAEWKAVERKSSRYQDLIQALAPTYTMTFVAANMFAASAFVRKLTQNNYSN